MKQVYEILVSEKNGDLLYRLIVVMLKKKHYY